MFSVVQYISRSEREFIRISWLFYSPSIEENLDGGASYIFEREKSKYYESLCDSQLFVIVET